MAEDSHTMGLGGELAKPLHLQHLERNLDVEPFLAYVEQIFNTPIRCLKARHINIEDKCHIIASWHALAYQLSAMDMHCFIVLALTDIVELIVKIVPV
jgi:hypothetical protein